MTHAETGHATRQIVSTSRPKGGRRTGPKHVYLYHVLRGEWDRQGPQTHHRQH
jgi:hypothetical protein